MLVLALLMAACGTPPAANIPPTPEATVVGAPTPAEQPAAAFIARAQQRLAAHRNIAPKAVTLQATTTQTWPNAALGCPEAGKVYAQVITPGYRLDFAIDDQVYAVHTDSDGTMVLCENNVPVALPNAS
jgi:hypothetical protein